MNAGDSDEEEDIIGAAIKHKSQTKVEDLENQVRVAQTKRAKTKEDDEEYERGVEELRQNLGDEETLKMVKNQKVDVEFELVAPCEPYFHIVRVLLNHFLDEEPQEKLNISGMSDYIVERASLGSVIASSLGNLDPDVDPACQKLSDEEFEKECLKRNATRDVYGVTSILSLTWSRSKQDFLQSIYDYAINKAAKYLDNEKQLNLFKQILNNKNVGLLVNERLINIPDVVVPDLHASMEADLEFTKEQDDIADPKEFNYEYLLAISRFAVPSEKVKGGKANRKERLYFKWEDDRFE